MKSRIRNLRIIGVAEGISFLVLLLIAMPLKYIAGIPAVRIVGWAHGLLFILYIATVLMAIKPMRWNFLNTVVALAVSVIPAGTFFLERSWRKRENEMSSDL